MHFSHIVGAKGTPVLLQTEQPRNRNWRPVPCSWGLSPLRVGRLHLNGGVNPRLRGSWMEFGRPQGAGCVSLAAFLPFTEPQSLHLETTRPGPGEALCPGPALWPAGDMACTLIS